MSLLCKINKSTLWYSTTLMILMLAALLGVNVKPTAAEDPEAAVFIDDVTQSESQTQFRFTVGIGPHKEKVAFDFRVVPDTAKAQSDYTAKHGERTFQPSNKAQTSTITVLVENDRADEKNESFTVVLSNFKGPAIFLRSTGIGTILDDDPQPKLSIFDASSMGGGDLKFRVELSGELNTPVKVDYATADGTAMAPNDYAAKMNTLTFLPGQLNKTITIHTKPVSSSKAFKVKLSNPQGAPLADGTATGAIQKIPA